MINAEALQEIKDQIANIETFGTDRLYASTVNGLIIKLGGKRKVETEDMAVAGIYYVILLALVNLVEEAPQNESS